MNSYRLAVRCIPFSRASLEEEVRLASKASQGSASPHQVRFLGSYLENDEAGARTILVEYPYVDRHFLEEYSHYYATSLHPPPPKATRLHFFKTPLTNRAFYYKLKRAANDGFDAVCRELSGDYLGFAVIRPLPDAPIGRTILRTYSSNDRRQRCYTLPPHPYRVHLCGLRLGVCGVPFQQQEQAVGACATSAVWSALAQVMRHDGGRAPTPFAVTEAATRHWVSDRVFPATSGLKNEQILEAIRQFGYAPLFFEPKLQTALFTLAVKCYLKSGIPVILKISYKGEEDAHAVTVVGFLEDDGTAVPEIEYQERGWTTLSLRSKGMSRLYVHDDRFGPYARAAWETDAATGFIKLRYLPREPGFEVFGRDAEVIAAMVPLYPKIRLSAQDLIGFAAELLPFFRQLVGQAHRDQLLIGLRFCLAGDCLELLYRSDIPAERIAVFARQANLSRYVGLIEFSVAETLVAYVVCDSTDMRRDAPAAPPLLAVIPHYDQHLEAIATFTKGLASNALVV